MKNLKEFPNTPKDVTVEAKKNGYVFTIDERKPLWALMHFALFLFAIAIVVNWVLSDESFPTSQLILMSIASLFGLYAGFRFVHFFTKRTIVILNANEMISYIRSVLKFQKRKVDLSAIKGVHITRKTGQGSVSEVGAERNYIREILEVDLGTRRFALAKDASSHARYFLKASLNNYRYRNNQQLAA